MSRITGVAAAFLLALPALALAQDGDAQDGGAQDGGAQDGAAQGGGAGEPLDVGALQEIEGIAVRNADGEQIGEIEEVLVDGSGRIVAVTVEIGGFLGMGDEELILTLDDLAWRGDGYDLDLTSDEMQSLPRFD